MSRSAAPSRSPTPGELARLRGLALPPRGRVEGRFVGPYAAVGHGRSVEFEEYRAWTPADPARSIDAKALMKTGRRYVRRHEHHGQATVRLLVDGSASMAFSGVEPDGESKLDRAAKLAGGLAYVATHRGGSVGLNLAGQGLSELVSIGSGLAHAERVIRAVEPVAAAGRAGLADAVSGLVRKGSTRAVLVLITDLIDDSGEGLLEALGAWIGRGGDAHVLQVLHPDELSLPGGVEADWVDPESGARVRASSDEQAADYRQAVDTWLDACRTGLVARGVGHALVRTDEPWVESLSRWLGTQRGAR